MLLRDRHAHRLPKALTQRPSRHLDPIRVAIFRMPRRVRAILPELFQVGDRDLIAAQVQHAVEHRRGVPIRQHKAVAIGPLRVLWIVTHVLVKEQVDDRRVAQRGARMPAVCLLYGVDCEESQRIDRQLVQFAHKSSSFLLLFEEKCVSEKSVTAAVTGPLRRQEITALPPDFSPRMFAGCQWRQPAGRISMSKFLPSQRFSPSHNRVNEMGPLCVTGTATSAKDPGNPMLVLSCVSVVAQPFKLDKSRKRPSATTRSVEPAFIALSGRLNLKISGFPRWRPSPVYRSSTIEIRSKTRPSTAERSSLRYSACAQTSGIAAPVGRPNSIPSIDGASQICSGIIPPSEANCSSALIYRPGSRPAAIS